MSEKIEVTDWVEIVDNQKDGVAKRLDGEVGQVVKMNDTAMKVRVEMQGKATEEMWFGNDAVRLLLKCREGE